MQKLLESDFLTVNIGSVLKTQKSFTELEPAAKANNQTPVQKRDLSQVSDFAKELKDRLDANSNLPQEQQKSNYEVETEFFEDFFTALTFDDACVKQLLSLGEPLRKIIRVLGFNKDTNPVLGFITQGIVIDNLIRTKYLNINTFKAVYNAVAKNLVASSEFFKANDYNIIYCQDLYKRSASEIEAYLVIQNNILNPSASTYTAVDQRKNKLVFFYLEDIKELDTERRKEAIKNLPDTYKLPSAIELDTKLNSLELVKVFSRVNKPKAAVKPKEQNGSSEDLTKNITNKAEAFAVLQQLSVNTDAPEVLEAMQHESFKNLSVEDLIKATARIKPILSKIELPKTEIRSFIELLLARLN